MSILQEGHVIRDTYQVERLVGEGAFAEVYRVKHRFLGRQAMKVFKTPGMTLKGTQEMLGEALLLSKIGHPNIVRVFDANLFDLDNLSYGYFTMEYVPGGSLENYWLSHSDQPMPVETVVNLVSQICQGLSLAHSSDPPIVHRDIKPQNILVGYDGDHIRLRISDFGLAKRVNPLTLLASARGTLVYKPPEVFADYRCDSCAGDVWAIGCIFYLLLTDEFPFRNLSESEEIGLIDFQSEVTSPSKINSQVDQYLEEIIAKCLEIDPAKRYPNAMALQKDLCVWQHNIGTKSDFEHYKNNRSGLSDLIQQGTEDQANQLCSKAIELSKNPNRLEEAAQMMEQAFRILPSLRERYEYLVGLWRKGLSG